MDLNTIHSEIQLLKSMLLSQKTVLNFNELVAYTGLSKSYLYKLTSSYSIPCYKPNGKLVYFSKDEIDTWLLNNRRQTQDELETIALNYTTLNKRGGK